MLKHEHWTFNMIIGLFGQNDHYKSRKVEIFVPIHEVRYKENVLEVEGNNDSVLFNVYQGACRVKKNNVSIFEYIQQQYLQYLNFIYSRTLLIKIDYINIFFYTTNDT